VGHKVHPIGFRLGVIFGWQSKWYADRHYADLVHEDLAIRNWIAQSLRDAGVSRVEIDRNANMVLVTVHTARPGIVIGRGGQKVDELRQRLEALSGKRVRVNIVEIRQPEIDATLVARSVAEQLERRVSHRRAMKQAVTRTMQRGAEGIKIIVGGRLGGAEMSRRETEKSGRVPLHTLRANIDYGTCEAHTTFGRIGVKVWIYKGEILPEPKVVQAPPAEAPAEAPVPAAEAPSTDGGTPPVAEKTPLASEGVPVASEGVPLASEGTPLAGEGKPIAGRGRGKRLAGHETPSEAASE
jgi:small subunit ribosomal protein S3